MKSQAPTQKPSLSNLTAELRAVANMAVDEVEELQLRALELQQRITHLRSMVDLIERRMKCGDK